MSTLTFWQFSHGEKLKSEENFSFWYLPTSLKWCQKIFSLQASSLNYFLNPRAPFQANFNEFLLCPNHREYVFYCISNKRCNWWFSLLILRTVFYWKHTEPSSSNSMSTLCWQLLRTNAEKWEYIKDTLILRDKANSNSSPTLSYTQTYLHFTEVPFNIRTSVGATSKLRTK